MFEQLFNQFVIAFREGIEASLIIMTVMVALRKRGESKLIKAAYAGIITAIIACAIGGYLLGSIALVNNHNVEFALYLGAALTVTTMVFWMMRAGKKFSTNIQTKIAEHDAQNWLSIIGMFAFVFFMISREGFEMVLLLLAFGAGIGGQWYVTAMLLGIACAVLLSYSLFRGALKFNLGKFLRLTSYVLLVFVVQLFFDVAHEGIEAGILPEPSSPGLDKFIDYVHDQVPIFSYIGLAFFAVVVIYLFGQALANRKSRKMAPVHSKTVKA